MAILIKGMEMPYNCWDCSLLNASSCPCKNYSSALEYTTNRHPNCPLVPVPEPHGRLIDADALHKLFEDQWHYLQVLDWNENPTAEATQSGINWCINTMHDDAPTVIPASVEGEA